MKNTVALILLLFTFINCSTIPVGFEKYDSKKLAARIDQEFNDSLFSHAHWGVLIKSLKTGELIYKRNADKMFMPASNEKIPTAAVALTELGPNFNFTTILGYSGELKDSTIYGDLIVIGDGDPTLSDRIYEKPTTVFEIWADSLLSLGIKEIRGNIIGDDNKFDDEHLGYGWPFDGLDYWYSAEIGALQLNENYIDLMFFPPKNTDDTLTIIPDVESEYYKLIKNITVVDTGRNNIQISSEFGKNNLLIEGNILRGSKSFEKSPTITNPTKFYVTVLKEVFENKGIYILGEPLDCDDVPTYKDSILIADTLLSHSSQSMAEILKVLMKKSQNLYAETIIRTLGYNESKLGSFKAGKKCVEISLENFGIKNNSHAFMDGSGLSRYNFISPTQIVKILEGMRQSKYWQEWYDFFPIAGIDGTLKNRMRNTKAESNVRAKTGTISNVRGLSGYVTTSEGEEIVFSFLINGHLRTAKETERITDKVLEMLAEYPIINSKN